MVFAVAHFPPLERASRLMLCFNGACCWTFPPLERASRLMLCFNGACCWTFPPSREGIPAHAMFQWCLLLDISPSSQTAKQRAPRPCYEISGVLLLDLVLSSLTANTHRRKRCTTGAGLSSKLNPKDYLFLCRVLLPRWPDG